MKTAIISARYVERSALEAFMGQLFGGSAVVKVIHLWPLPNQQH
jgi:hypothetical protein